MKAINVNPNQLHDELLEAGIEVVLLEHDKKESAFIADNTWITFHEGTDMEVVNQVIDNHEPKKSLPTISTNDVLMMAIADLDAQREQDKIEQQLALAELASAFMGGNF